VSEYRKWTPEGEADAAGAVARALGSRDGCRRAIFVAAVVALVMILIALLAHIIFGLG
jgi:hypothetical protein